MLERDAFPFRTSTREISHAFAPSAPASAWAVHYLRPNGQWSTDGWFSIQPGKTLNLSVDSRNTVFYVHAVRIRDGKVYTLGDTIERWVCDQPFSLVNNAQPAAGGRMALFSQYEAPNLSIAINFN